ncbi:hypothetical protein [Geomonas sp.]|uniref:hypothetical protein n=1 Tax=Geomonas sp. TaxID=2651584 RepID=UPI002B49D2B2|nr:hypothetical protein [Geomonas sp.]HJV34263.1 hypothetical protein [Geomonas sp.]
MARSIVFALLMVAAAATAAVAASWNFDREKSELAPAGFYVTAGQWKVKADPTAPSKPNVLAQIARSSLDTYNVVLIADSSYKNVDLSVKMRPVAGLSEQGGGVVWRALDGRNYYLASYNPLSGEFLLYKVQNFGRIQLGRAQTGSFAGWRTIRVVMTGDHIEGYLDGRKYLDARDGSFPEAGRIGLWTRGDSLTYFDDLSAGAH